MKFLKNKFYLKLMDSDKTKHLPPTKVFAKAGPENVTSAM